MADVATMTTFVMVDEGTRERKVNSEEKIGEYYFIFMVAKFDAIFHSRSHPSLRPSLIFFDHFWPSSVVVPEARKRLVLFVTITTTVRVDLQPMIHRELDERNTST